VSFPDHIVTVSSYLEAYRREQDEKTRMVLRGRFTEYLISACWPKMLSRAKHWVMVGLVSELAKVPYNILLDMEEVPSNEPDTRLATILLDVDKADYLKGPLSFCQPPGYTKGDNSIPGLLTTSKGSRPLYTKVTAIEFHRLLVGTLILYAWLIAVYAKSNIVPEERFAAAADVGLAGAFLHGILFSDAFNCHMKSLFGVEDHIVTLPTSAHFEEYCLFAQKHEIRILGPRGKRKVHGVSSGSSKGGKKKSELSKEGKKMTGLFTAGESKQAGVGDEDDGSGANADDDGIPDATSELNDQLPTGMASLESPPGHQEPRLEPSEFCQIISSWLKFLVKYHTAQGTLESYCQTLGPGDKSEVDIKLLEVNPKQGLMPEWKEIKEVIASILQKTERPNVELKDTANMLTYISTRVNNIVASGRSYHNTLNIFSQIIEGVDQVTQFTVHCEAALVAFASTAVNENGPNAQINEGDPLRSLWKV